MPMVILYEKLNNFWKSTCRVLLGDEVGELKDFEKFLSRYYLPPVKRKGIYMPYPLYPENGEYQSLNKVDFMKKYEPLNINEIKDIDSIVSALKERFVYTGNIVLGNSHYVEETTKAINSNFVWRSNDIYNSKYVAYSSIVNGASYVFGIHDAGTAEFVINSTAIGGTKVSRLFETSLSADSSDVYYSFHIVGSNEVLFSFFQRGKRYMIGNIQLEKDRYMKIKKALLEQIRSELESRHNVFGLLDVLSDKKELEGVEEIQEKECKFDYKRIDNAFRQTFKTLLKTEPNGDIDSYKKFLSQDNPLFEYKKGKTLIKKKEMPIPGDKYVRYIKNVYLDEDEIQVIANRKGDIKQLEEGIEERSLEKIKKAIEEIAFTSAEYSVDCANTRDLAMCYKSSDVYKTQVPVFSKTVAYSVAVAKSNYIFGSTLPLNSSFALKVHLSNGINRGFEVDSCYSSSDIYFSHNCEGMIEAMFCFNIKSKRFAIGNAEYSKDTYYKFKENLLSQIADELNSKKEFRYSIYSIGTR